MCSLPVDCAPSLPVDTVLEQDDRLEEADEAAVRILLLLLFDDCMSFDCMLLLLLLLLLFVVTLLLSAVSATDDTDAAADADETADTGSDEKTWVRFLVSLLGDDSHTIVLFLRFAR